MILVDTSVWINHLRMGNPHLSTILEQGEVVTHPFVVGELACGVLRNRSQVLAFLRVLPLARAAEHEEVLQFVEDNGLYGRGIGWTDAHLLASARLSDIALWTLDKPLLKVATAMSLALETT